MISETTTESQIEHHAKIGCAPTSMSGPNVTDMYKRKLIQILQCEKCGELKRFVEEI
jgi:hypothetical protein